MFVAYFSHLYVHMVIDVCKKSAMLHKTCVSLLCYFNSVSQWEYFPPNSQWKVVQWWHTKLL